MSTKKQTLVILAVVMVLLISACGPGPISLPAFTPTPMPTLTPTPIPTPIPTPHEEKVVVKMVSSDAIKKLATDLSLWRFRSQEDVHGIVVEARELNIFILEYEMENIGDNDDHKRLMYYVDPIAKSLARFYGERAEALFWERHLVSLTELWSGDAGKEGISPSAKRVIIRIAAAYMDEAVGAVKPIGIKSQLVADGEAIAKKLLDLSKADAPNMDELRSAVDSALVWDKSVSEALQNTPCVSFRWGMKYYTDDSECEVIRNLP